MATQPNDGRKPKAKAAKASTGTTGRVKSPAAQDKAKLARIAAARKALEKLELADANLGRQLIKARAELAAALKAA